jgi:hypothetical protein
MAERMDKTLGRCARKHSNIVVYVVGTLPSGTCGSRAKDKSGQPVGEPCGETLIEWALKAPKDGGK